MRAQCWHATSLKVVQSFRLSWFYSRVEGGACPPVRRWFDPPAPTKSDSASRPLEWQPTAPQGWLNAERSFPYRDDRVAHTDS